MGRRILDFVDIATDYARKVVSGKILACKFVKQACKRQLRDLEKWKRKNSPFHFDRESANEVCGFIEKFPHVKGEWAKRGELIKLEPWQAFIVTTVFGWKRRDARRRFRTAYIEVGRKNAKTSISAPIGLYMLTADEEQGSEVFSAATTRDQAKIVFRDAWQMARKEPGFRKRYGVQVMQHNINRLETGSKFEPLSAEGNSLDGLNPHCAIIDELHAHKTRQVFDVLETAMGARSQPLLWCITTAGSNQTGICYEQRDYVTKILDGSIKDETYFGVIFTLDEKDSWDDEKVWIKANPNIGVSLYPDYLRSQCNKARKSAQAQAAFKTKHLDIWLNADVSFMNMELWAQCADTSLNIEDFTEDECFLGVDLSTKKDITSKVRLFRRDGVYYLFSEHYLPEDRVHDEGHAKTAHYEAWAIEGHLKLTAGSKIDLDAIEAGIREDLSTFNVIAVGHDPWQAAQMVGHLMDDGAPMVEIRQNAQHLSEPMKEVEAQVLAGNLKHNDNPVMNWMVSNVVCHTDANDNIFPKKAKPENKIDGFVALLNAMNRALAATEDTSSPYNERGVLEVEF